MQYIENSFYPAWLPHRYRGIIDLSELAKPTDELIREANALMETLDVNVAIYKTGHHPATSTMYGLCTVFTSALLHDQQLACLKSAEQRHQDFVFVAYAKPLQHHNHVDLSDLFQRHTVKDLYY